MNLTVNPMTEKRDWSRAMDRFLNLFDTPYRQAMEELVIHEPLKDEVHRRRQEYEDLRELALELRAGPAAHQVPEPLRLAVEGKFLPHVEAVREMVKIVQSIARFKDRPLWFNLKAWCDDMVLNLAMVKVTESPKPAPVPKAEPVVLVPLVERLEAEEATHREMEPYLEERTTLESFIERERRAEGEGFFNRLGRVFRGSGKDLEADGEGDVGGGEGEPIPYQEILKMGYVDLKGFAEMRRPLGNLIDGFTDLLKRNPMPKLPVVRVGGCIQDNASTTRRVVFHLLLKNLALVEEALTVIHRDAPWEECQTVFFNPMLQYLQEIHFVSERILGAGRGLPEDLKPHVAGCVAHLRALSEKIHMAEESVA